MHYAHTDGGVSAICCKPKSPKIPSTRLQPRHDRIQVDDLSVAAKGFSVRYT